MRSDTLRARLETQGYCDLGDPDLAVLGPWLRFAPASCLTFMVIGTTLAAPAVLWGLAAVAAVGALTTRHPFDALYNRLVRRWTGTSSLPRHGAPRRFACGVAAVWLTAEGAAFAAGAPGVGFVLGGVIVGMASVVSFTHFCIPSWVYRALFGWSEGERRRPVRTG